MWSRSCTLRGSTISKVQITSRRLGLNSILRLSNTMNFGLISLQFFFLIALYQINNGNRTEWSPSPIWSIITRVINKIGRPLTSFHLKKKKKQLTWRNARQQCTLMTRTVHLHRRDVSTVLLHCPVTSMTHTQSYECSNRAGDNQSRSRILF